MEKAVNVFFDSNLGNSNVALLAARHLTDICISDIRQHTSIKSNKQSSRR
jgi:hypothetical protein